MILNFLNKLAPYIDATVYIFCNPVQLSLELFAVTSSHVVNSPALSTFKSRLLKLDLSFYLSEFQVQVIIAC